MARSAENSCPGCRFFLDYIRQWSFDNRQVDMEAFVESRRDIFIGVGRHLRTSLPGYWRVPFRQKLILCLNDAPSFLDPDNYYQSGKHVSRMRRPIPKDPRSESCFDMVAAWIESCRHHSLCGPHLEVALPKMVIVVSSNDKEASCLHITSAGEVGQYVTLSYCWGAGNKLLLTNKNMSALQSDIPFQDLSKTLQDAITIPRKLGFKYLWIDALCIIQDNEADWAEQASLMADIYSMEPSCSSYGIDEPLSQRAWAYQERLLAPRILHFRKEKMSWGCSTGAYLEDTGLKLNKDRLLFNAQPKFGLNPFISKAINNFTTSSAHDKSKQGVFSRLEVYYWGVKEYCQRGLTYSRDKLPAFAGIVRSLSSPALGTYLCGLWENDFAYGLDWSCGLIAKDYSSYKPDPKAPSWSWASASKPCFPSSAGHLWRFPGNDSSERRQMYEMWTSTFAPTLVSFNIDLASDDPYGRVNSASVVIRGYCRPLLLHISSGDNERIFPLDSERAQLDNSPIEHQWSFAPPHPFTPWEFSKPQHDSASSQGLSLVSVVFNPVDPNQSISTNRLNGSTGSPILSILDATRAPPTHSLSLSPFYLSMLLQQSRIVIAKCFHYLEEKSEK
ncbi:HET-domain-containing protein [Aulographum hederae CBS 113979]|uniref:HET-domain-containing protein n=1 Tax=Aulographum hederae CBS 113979 TaxID=1176131 RepID=A0A6G1GIT1_9PEZI|nr:HET-domain-containing protein [Aulographum hederae CBS 113979]